MAVIEELPKSLCDLILAVESTNDMTPANAAKLLRAVEVEEGDLEPWRDDSHPLTNGYGRKMVYDAGYFEIMVMTWNCDDWASIHDHGLTQWGAVQIFGPAEHASFSLDGKTLRTLRRHTCQPGDVIAIPHELLHQMGNLAATTFFSLHLYGSYDVTSQVTADARIIDLDAKQIQITTGGSFFNLPATQYRIAEDNIEADFPTYLRHQVEMMRQLLKAGKEHVVCQRGEAIAAELSSAELWMGLTNTQGLAATDREKKNFLHELQAACQMQDRLIEADALGGPLLSQAAKIKTLARQDHSEEFGQEYLALLSQTFNQDFRVALS